MRPEAVEYRVRIEDDILITDSFTEPVRMYTSRSTKEIEKNDETEPTY